MPRVTLNPRSVGGLVPRSGRNQDYFWDQAESAPRGFGVRVSAMAATGSTSRTYVVTYRIHGRQRFYKLGAVDGLSLKKARKLAGEALEDVANGIDPQARKVELRDAGGVAGLVAAFVERGKTKRGGEKAATTKRFYRQMLRAEIDGSELGRASVATVTGEDIRAHLERIAKRGAPVLANRAYQLIKAAFAWGVFERLVDVDPCRTLRRPRPDAEEPGDRVLSPDEIKLVWEALDLKDGDAEDAPRIVPAPVTAATRLMLLLGTRRGETFRMRWQDVDVGARLWRIPGELRKGGEPLVVPLSLQAITILEELILEGPSRSRKAEDWTFVGPEGGCIVKNPGRIGAAVARAYKAACKAEKRKPEPWTFHDLRRTCATGCGELGAPPHVVALILGHKTMPGWGNVTAIYDRAQRARDVAPWLQRWADRVEVILTGQEHKGADVVPLVRA